MSFPAMHHQEVSEVEMEKKRLALEESKEDNKKSNTGLSLYEQRRLENIERNRQVLASLGLGEGSLQNFRRHE